MSKSPDRLEIEALREAVNKSEEKASVRKEEAVEFYKKYVEIWDKDFEVLILSLRKAIADKVPRDLRSVIISRCVRNIVVLLTPVETAGTFMSLLSDMFAAVNSGATPSVVMIGGHTDLAELLGVKDNSNDKTTSVV